MKKILITIAACVFAWTISFGTTYSAIPGNYTTFLSSLTPGDTLLLQNGSYTNFLVLNGMNGSAGNPIVIIGSSQSGVVFLGNACCNTVSITQCSYIVLQNFTIDGQNIPGIDGVKAEGTTGNWAHHITIEGLKIIGHGGDQQTDGISTKCTVWDWVIRRNIIDAAGTGLYLGNSTGNSPFVNGIIEGNVVKNTIGYNMEIKPENNGLRTIAGMPLNGKTIIRYNVFTKELNASTGIDARPCVLVDPYPSTGNGSNDYYEIYNNLFYENPVEALFQGTGNIVLYNNIFVNHQSGGWGVEIRDHNAFQPRDVKAFHNTIVVNGGTGLHFYNCDTGYQQYAMANAVFASPAITTNTTLNNIDNVTATYVAASTYLNAPFSSVPSLNCFPQSGQLTGTLSSNTLFTSYINYASDFNNTNYNWIYRGAYSGSGANTGWVLQIDTMPMPSGGSVGIAENKNNIDLNIFPNPSEGIFFVETYGVSTKIKMYNSLGEKILETETQNKIKLNENKLANGIYFFKITQGEKSYSRKLLVQK